MSSCDTSRAAVTRDPMQCRGAVPVVGHPIEGMRERWPVFPRLDRANIGPALASARVPPARASATPVRRGHQRAASPHAGEQRKPAHVSVAELESPRRPAAIDWDATNPIGVLPAPGRAESGLPVADHPVRRRVRHQVVAHSPPGSPSRPAGPPSWPRGPRRRHLQAPPVAPAASPRPPSLQRIAAVSGSPPEGCLHHARITREAARLGGHGRPSTITTANGR